MEQTKKKFSDLVSVVSGILSLLSAFAFVLSSFLKFNEKILFLASSGATFLIWFLYNVFKASKAFKSTKKLPFPSSLWRFIFNELPTGVGHVYDNTNRTKVLIIYNEYSRDKFLSIKEKYSDAFLSIDSILIQGKDFADELLKKLESCDALLFFYTKQLKYKEILLSHIDKWAFENSHKPILGVTDCPYDITYNSVQEKNADSSVWRLMLRSTERAEQWRAQAKLFRKIGISLMIFLLIGIVWIICNYQKNYIADISKVISTELSILDSSAKNADSRKLSILRGGQTDKMKERILNVFEEYKENKALRFEKTRGILNSYLKQVLTRIQRDNSLEKISEKPFHLSLWIYHPKQKEAIFRVAWAPGEQVKMRKMAFDSNSIIGCSISNPGNFVFWKSNLLKEGDDAIWPMNSAFTPNLRSIGWWKKDENGKWGIFDKNNKKVGSYKIFKTDPTERKGLLCVSINSSVDNKKANENPIYGLCIDTDNDTEFLKDEETLKSLFRTLVVLSAVPSEVFKEFICSFETKGYQEKAHLN